VPAPSCAAGNTALRHLDVADCELLALPTAACLLRLPSRSALQHLVLCPNFSVGSLLRAEERKVLGGALATLTALTCLALDEVDVATGPTSSLFPHLTSLRSLAALSASNCWIPRTYHDVDALVKQLEALAALTRLDLRKNYWLQQADVDKLVAAFSGKLAVFEMERVAGVHPEVAAANVRQLHDEQMMHLMGLM
jgi:hypothetical protein